LRAPRALLRPVVLFAIFLGTATVARPAPPAPAGTVYLAAGRSDEERITVPAAVAAARHGAVVLFDSASSQAQTEAFLRAFQPEQVNRVGQSARQDLEQPPSWQKALFSRARRVVVAPARPRRLLLQAAWLAGLLRAPLVVSREGDATGLQHAVAFWASREVVAVGSTYRLCRDLADIHVVRLLDEAAVTAAALRHLERHGPVHTLVVANPADDRPGQGGMAALAPWIALEKRAALLLTNETGTNVETVVAAALKHEALLRADAVILVGNLKAIPVERRPNPTPGKDVTIEMEPLTPRGQEPFSFAVGRLFHDDPNVVALMLARQRLLPAQASGKALVVSDPGSSLPLLQAVSRSTAQELDNAGYRTTSLCGSSVTAGAIRRLLPEQDIFLWEGHYSTLVRDYGIHRWPEPLQPSLIFLQSCLALTEDKAQPFLQRGALGVVGSATRTYSGSGGAIALAYLDALLYEHQSLGGSLRQAKNFLLAFSLLKEKRLAGTGDRAGASLRTAWAFTLWGDPTVKLPAPPAPTAALAHVRHRVQGKTIIVSLPDHKHARVVTAGYHAEIRPNVHLAGLCCKKEEDDGHGLVPLVFVEAHLPGVPPGATPRLSSRLSEKAWVFLWDQRRASGYLLVRPRAADHGEIRFHVAW
jgi:hypothetical protein